MIADPTPPDPAAAALYRGGTLAEMVPGAIARYPDRPAFANDQTAVTYRQLGPVLLQSDGQTEAPNDILMLGRDGHARLDDAADAALAGEAISQHVRQAKGAVASPKRVAFIAALPQTALGKIDKKALRARHWAPDTRAVN